MQRPDSRKAVIVLGSRADEPDLVTLFYQRRSKAKRLFDRATELAAERRNGENDAHDLPGQPVSLGP